MATFKGVNQTLIDAQGESKIAGGLVKVKTKTIKDSYVILGTEGTGSVIKLFGALPAGAILQSINIDVSAAQASANVDVGDSASATRYATDDTGIATALGVKTYTRTIVACGQYVVGTASGDNQITLTTGGATLTAGTLYAEITYTDPVD